MLKNYEIPPENFQWVRKNVCHIYSSYDSKGNPEKDSIILYRGTQGELYDALRNERYQRIIEFYYRWKRGLYQLPPFAEAPYRITETFNVFTAYDG